MAKGDLVIDKTRFEGRRLPDTVESRLPDGWQEPGSYWKVLNEQGQPKLVEWPDKLTKDCWRVSVPFGEDGYALGNLERHTVREHEDGTISVVPGDGSSNSILIHGHDGLSWHGYVDHGVFYTA